MSNIPLLTGTIDVALENKKKTITIVQCGLRQIMIFRFIQKYI